ncbi:hypothetical protein BGZ94_000541 [Podila epigama]|nr:hypothetical protein BGZ94_000541 [Podila epigama]
MASSAATSTTSRPRRAAAAASNKQASKTPDAPPSRRTSKRSQKQQVLVPRKRAKKASTSESEHDEEDDEIQETSSNEDSDDDDAFQDDSGVRRAVGKQSKKSPNTKSPTKTKASTTTTKSKVTLSKSSSNSSLKASEKMVPTHTFVKSKLVIPRPKGGPVADAIQPETLEFIRDLKENNDRSYMMLNQERFNQAKADFIDFIRMIKEGLREADPDVMDQEPKDAMMRIYRDIRFSNDKTPYKSQMSCHFSKGGRKSIAAGYYFHISSGNKTFAGCGVWDPSGPVLNRIRHGIVNHADRYNAILATEAIKELTGGRTGVDALLSGPALKTGPVGFDKDGPMIEFLKRKNFAIGRTFTDEEAVNPGFLEEVLRTFDACVDFVHILNDWIG